MSKFYKIKKQTQIIAKICNSNKKTTKKIKFLYKNIKLQQIKKIILIQKLMTYIPNKQKKFLFFQKMVLQRNVMKKRKKMKDKLKKCNNNYVYCNKHLRITKELFLLMKMIQFQEIILKTSKNYQKIIISKFKNRVIYFRKKMIQKKKKQIKL